MERTSLKKNSKIRSIEEEELFDVSTPISPSGTNVVFPNRRDYGEKEFHIIRSIVMDADGYLNIDSFINEIFGGYFNPSIEYIGLPSTIVLNGGNVIMASQIFDRPFEQDFKDGIYSHVSNIEEYFAVRKTNALRNTGKFPIVTWIGSPSVTFNYENRNILNDILGSSGLNLIFWLTSFNSTACIVKADVSKYKYCNRFHKIKKLCNNKSDYQIHDTYSNYMSKNNKFITNFEDAIHAIAEEKEAIDKYNEEHASDCYQRYNEMVTYFFPWDINGIEIGMTNPNNTKRLADSLLFERNKFSDRYQQLVETKDVDELKEYFNILIKDYIKLQNKEELLSLGYHISDILFCRFLLYCKCGSSISFSGEQLKNALIFIMQKLKEPLEINEYIINPDTRSGTFIMKGYYSGSENSLLARASDFSLFIQKKNQINPKLTQVIPTTVPFFNSYQGIGKKYKKNLRKSYKRSNSKRPRVTSKNRIKK
jgi:hypothetical protein